MQVKPNDLTTPPGLLTGQEYADKPAPDIEELLAYKDYLEQELQRVKMELRRKVQR
jgi:hypothetical protein